MPLTLDIAELPAGVRLPYAEQGPPEGVPLVLLHGLSDSWRSFEPLLAHLPSTIHAFAVTARGHGDASRHDSYAVADMVQDVAQFLDAVGLRSAIIVGHSMGSIVATRFAIDHPDRTDALVVMGGATSFARLGMEEMRAELRAMDDPVDPDYLRAFQESTLARPIPPAYLDLVVAESCKVPIAALRGAFEDTCLVDFAVDLGRIAAPTLLIWGEEDAFCPRSEQDALLKRIRGARLIVHEGSGHAMHWEDPERVAAELAAFAGEVRG